MNKLLFSFVVFVCLWFVTACAVTNINDVNDINDCDGAVAYFNQLATDESKENLKRETLTEVLSDAPEGSEGVLYRDDSEDIRLIEIIHYGGSGKQLVNYTILDEQNYRVDIARVVYDMPISSTNPIEKDRLTKRVDTCDGVEVDVYTDRPESSDLRTYSLDELLQIIPIDEL